MRMEAVTPSQEPKPAGRRPFLPYLAFGLMLLLLLVGVGTVRKIGAYGETLQKQEADIKKLKAEAESLKTGEPIPGDNTSTDGKPGRREQDNQTAADFLKHLLTWGSYEEYTSVRDWLASDYQVPETDAMLTVFMPKLDEQMFGNNNMHFEKARTYQVAEQEGAVSYFAVCDVSNKIDGNAAYGRVGVFYTISKDGAVSGISAYALAG